jgi:phenylalanyl-tRNA synthetase beta chain
MRKSSGFSDSLGFTAGHVPTCGWHGDRSAAAFDIHREVDLIEELARHYGFDRIPSHFPALTRAPAAIDPRITRARQLRAVLTGAGSARP